VNDFDLSLERDAILDAETIKLKIRRQKRPNENTYFLLFMKTLMCYSYIPMLALRPQQQVISNISVTLALFSYSKNLCYENL